MLTRQHEPRWRAQHEPSMGWTAAMLGEMWGQRWGEHNWNIKYRETWEPNAPRNRLEGYEGTRYRVARGRRFALDKDLRFRLSCGDSTFLPCSL